MYCCFKKLPGVKLSVMFKRISLLFILSSVFLLLIGVKPTSAQGAYQCSCTDFGTLGGHECSIPSSWCEAGYKPNCNNCPTSVNEAYCSLYPSRLVCTDTDGQFTDSCTTGIRGGIGSSCVCSGDCLTNLICLPGTTSTCQRCCTSDSDCTMSSFVGRCNGVSSYCSSGRLCSWTPISPTPASGTYICRCSLNTAGGYVCNAIDGCASGFMPNANNCPQTTNVEPIINGCSPLYRDDCVDNCVPGQTIAPGGTGCTNDYECPTGYFCNIPDIPPSGGTYSCEHCCTQASDCPSEYGYNFLCDLPVSTSHCTSGRACSRTTSSVYCGRYGEPCCEGGTCDSSLDLACNTELGICLGSDRSCTCVPQGQPECLISDRCGRGYAEQCTGVANGYCTSSGCTCVVNYEPVSESMNLSRLYGAIQSSGGLFRFSSTLTLGEIVSNALTIIFPLAGLVLLLMLIYGGYNLMFSAGDPKKAQASREIITTALIGFAIIFIAFWLTIIVGRILGLSDIFNIF